MPQVYEVVAFKKGDFQDQNGNYWCDMALKGISEPVRIVVKDPTQFHDGMELYGHITDETSKAGKPYRRFRRDKQPDFHETAGGAPKKSEWIPRDDSAIKAQFAIKAAVAAYAMPTLADTLKDPAALDVYFNNVEHFASQFYSMVDRVKDSGLKATGVEGQPVPDEFKDKVVEFDDEAPINLADIPF
jgi:hypothetical protein